MLAILLAAHMGCAAIAGPNELLPAATFEGANPASAGWTLTGAGEVASPGYNSAQCVAVRGSGDDTSQWTASVHLTAGATYRLRFWARAEGGDGCAVTGPAEVNRDFTPGPEWGDYSFVFRAPEHVADPTPIHFGQWHWKGTIWYDNVSLALVEALCTGDAGLGEGEAVNGKAYTFTAPLGGEGSTYSRGATSIRVQFNSNRFPVAPGATLVFAHDVPGATQVAAAVSPALSYYSSGAVMVEASRDGTTWTPVGEARGEAGARLDLPKSLFPAERVYIRLTASPDAGFQIVGYAYRATLDRDLGRLTGRTVFLERISDAPSLAVTVISLKPDRIVAKLREKSGAGGRATVSAALAGKTIAEQSTDLAANAEQTVTLAIRPRETGLLPLALTVVRGAERYEALTTLTVPALALADYGEVLSAGDAGVLWWCDATHKIGLDRTPPTERATDGVRIEAAKGEFEPFQLVLTPGEDAKGIVPIVSDLTAAGDARIPAAEIEIEHVEYLEVTTPTDPTSEPGWWPDPLRRVDGPFDVTKGRNHPLWVRVHVPRDAPAGDYAGALSLRQKGTNVSWAGADPVRIRLHVYDFALPEKERLTATFGIDAGSIFRYHNVTGRADQELVWDLYMRNFRDHRTAPYDPMALWPIRLNLTGVSWNGGTIDTERPASGPTCLRVEDKDPKTNVSAVSARTYPVDRTKPLRFAWTARVLTPAQPYQVTISSFDAGGNWMTGRNIDLVYTGGTDWKPEEVTLDPGRLPEGAVAVQITLWASPWSEAGESMGTTWYDDVFLGLPGGQNWIADPSFEPRSHVPKVDLDFAAFDKAGEKYLDGYGFSSFVIRLQGMPSGGGLQETPGEIGGFKQGTPEYEQIMHDYLGQIERHLREKGWLGKAFVYWYDEPEPRNYPFVRKGMELLARRAPGLRRMLTEQPEPDLVGAVNVWCPVTPAYNQKTADERLAAGDVVWWYVCTGPKAPWCTLFIDHPATDLRVWLWQTFGHGVTGVLVWSTTWWYSGSGEDPDIQNPWTDPMGYVGGNPPSSGHPEYWGNGDGRFLYPANRDPKDRTTKYLAGPANSIRWEMLREGIEDYEYLVTLRDLVTRAKAAGKPDVAAEALLKIPETIYSSMTKYTVDPAPIYAQRRLVAEAIERLSRALAR